MQFFKNNEFFPHFGHSETLELKQWEDTGYPEGVN